MCGDVWMRGLVCVSAVGGGVKVGWSRSEKCVWGGWRYHAVRYSEGCGGGTVLYVELPSSFNLLVFN